MIRFSFLVILLAFAQSPDLTMERLQGNHKVQDALKYVDEDLARTTREVGGLFPPDDVFSDEEQSAKQVQALFKSYGLSEVQRDTGGNVLGLRSAAPGLSAIAIVAPLRCQSCMHGLIAMERAIGRAMIETPVPLLFIATVGADDTNPRGLQYVFGEGSFKNRVKLLVEIKSGPEGSISIVPKTMGSTIAQTAMQAVIANGVEPVMDNDLGDTVVPVGLRIPSVRVGAGASSAKGVKMAMLLVLGMTTVR